MRVAIYGRKVSKYSAEYFTEMLKCLEDFGWEVVLEEDLKALLVSKIGISEKYPLKYYEGQKLAIFNEAGFLEIAIFRSNPDTVGSATSLLGLSYRDVVTIEFRN